MTKTSVPEIDTGGEGDGGGRGGGGMHRVEGVGTITSVEYHPGMLVLHRETKFVKFNSDRIFMTKTTNRD